MQKVSDDLNKMKRSFFLWHHDLKRLKLNYFR
jgi:hypothetical protein